MVTLEAAGVYHEGIVYYLHGLGFQIFLSNPGKAKKFSQSLSQTHKTDKSDSIMLARYGYSQNMSVRLWGTEAPEVRELKAMSRRLAALEKDCHRESNRLGASKISSASKLDIKSTEDMRVVLMIEIEYLK